MIIKVFSFQFLVKEKFLRIMQLVGEEYEDFLGI